MLRFIRCVLALLIYVRSGDCLTCYSCSSSQSNEECNSGVYAKNHLYNATYCNQMALDRTRQYAIELDGRLEEAFRIDIRHFEPQLPTTCLRLSLRVGNRDVVLRGCQLAHSEKMDICERIQKATNDHLHLIRCSLCNSDYCNTASISHISLTLALLVSMFCKILNY